MRLVKKLSKNGTTILLDLEIKANRNRTELSKHIWELKAKRDIASRARPCNGCTRKCDLCLTEKLTIAKADPSSLLNALDEFICQCRHMNKFTLKSFKISLPW